MIEVLCEKLKSPEWHLRAAATDAMSKLCDVGDIGTVEALMQLLKVSYCNCSIQNVSVPIEN